MGEQRKEIQCLKLFYELTHRPVVPLCHCPDRDWRSDPALGSRPCRTGRQPADGHHDRRGFDPFSDHRPFRRTGICAGCAVRLHRLAEPRGCSGAWPDAESLTPPENQRAAPVAALFPVCLSKSVKKKKKKIKKAKTRKKKKKKKKK